MERMEHTHCGRRFVDETVVGDVEVQHQRHRVHRVRKVDRQMDIPTMSTPDFSNMLSLGFMGGTEKVRQFLNHPVMILFGICVSLCLFEVE
jgi:hypothetical protein